MNLLISACLMGVRCRYDGGRKPLDCLNELMDRHVLIPVCPDVLGGLPTPRVPAERQGERVVTKDGRDVTEAYLRGAQQALELARKLGCTVAVLKEKSPSCGSGRIYDGSFTGTLTDGWGTAAQLLQNAGLRVLGESELAAFLRDN